jgi:hypothetical protein
VIVAALCLVAGTAVPQDSGMLDVAVYRNEAFGVALPRPFPDWVFSPGGSRETITVLFHPREAPLSEQLWGALVLTSFDGPIPLGEIADQRVQSTWQPALGRTFRLLTRDSLSVAGLPAIHVVMAGAVNRLAVDVEEYFVVRGRDLIIVQFRYPRGLPRDSVAEGYQRAFGGLVIRPPPGEAAPAPVAMAPPQPPTDGASAHAAAANRALAASPWRPRAYEGVVRFDPAAVRADFSVRVEIVNEDVRPRDSLVFAVRWPLELDTVRSATGQPLATLPGEAVASVRLPQPVEPQAATAVIIVFHAPALAAPSPEVAVSAVRARVLADWLPIVAPSADSLGRPLDVPHPRFSLRFDLPEGFTAVAAGRLAADFASAGRRRITWVADDEPTPAPVFVIGRLRRAAMRVSPLVALRTWAREAVSPAEVARAGALADIVLEAWTFFTGTFGRLAVEDVDLVLTDVGRPVAAGGALFVDPAASDDSARLAVARAWWGSTVRFAGPGSSWLADALPAWSVLLMRAAAGGDSTRQRLVRQAEAAEAPLASLEAARRAVGDAAFRTALRGFFLDHRTVAATAAELLSILGPDGAAAIQRHLQGR